MKHILVLYGTTEGQTRKIAEFIGAALRKRGCLAVVLDSASPEADRISPSYAGAILGGSLHQGKHQAALEHFVRAHAGWLASIPTAFFSVSLAAAGADEEEHAEAKRLAEQFIADTGLKPVASRCIAGALKYTQYDFMKRFVMKMIAKREGGSTDTSRDHEYTDWSDVERFVDEFLSAASLAPEAAVAEAVH
jgi:menaquinone-dependent protoporphyrinogen oxidase